MSKSSTPSSSSHPSTPSQPSSRGSHSDTTPSPGSTKSTRFDPYALSSRLAFLEASESLAQAAETLAVASKAMSKAAASLAMATSGYYHYELDNSAIKAPDQQPPGWVDTSNWENPLFALPTSLVLPDKTAEQPADTGERSTMPTKDEAPILEDTPTAPQSADISESQTTPTLSQIGQETHPNTFPEPETVTYVSPVSTAIPSTNPEPVEAQEAELSTEESEITSDSSEDIGGDTEEEEDIEDESDAGDNTESEEETSSEDGDQDPYELPSQNPSSGPSSASDKPFTLIVLDRGFDEVPAIAKYASHAAKTICFWKYWSSAMSLGSALRSITSKETIIPSSLKPNKLKEAANEFTLPSFKGILIWPAESSFWDAADWNHSPKTLLIHAGYPLGNIDLETNRRVIIMAQSEWKNLDSSQTRYIRKHCYLDANSSAYNQNGDDTALEPGRDVMRSHFGKAPPARAFYVAWIIYQRNENPGWSTKHLVTQANLYAREYLLRCGNGGKKWIGERVALSMGQIQAMNLEPAVDAGILSVA